MRNELRYSCNSSDSWFLSLLGPSICSRSRKHHPANQAPSLPRLTRPAYAHKPFAANSLQRESHHAPAPRKYVGGALVLGASCLVLGAAVCAARDPVRRYNCLNPRTPRNAVCAPPALPRGRRGRRFPFPKVFAVNALRPYRFAHHGRQTAKAVRKTRCGGTLPRRPPPANDTNTINRRYEMITAEELRGRIVPRAEAAIHARRSGVSPLFESRRDAASTGLPV
jgi:hypothetical protein